jgi:hemoglobin-like flavoprotein
MTRTFACRDIFGFQNFYIFFSLSDSFALHLFGLKTKMVLADLGYHHINAVIETWELARQRHGCEEQLGLATLFNLFDLDSSTKAVFGFKPNQDVKNHPMLRMGALTHAVKIIQMLDSVLSLLGPDVETLEEILSQLGARHTRIGVTKEHFSLLGRAVTKAVRDTIGDDWTDGASEAWDEVYRELSQEITKGM